MQLQAASQIRKLTNEELTLMVNNAFVALTKGKTEERKATYIYEAEGSWSTFKHCGQYDNNTIFLSLIDMSYFNPLCATLYSQYPNIAEHVMRQDNMTALINLIHILVQKGYKLAIRDTFYDPDVTLTILEVLKAYGYDTNMVVFKNGLYNDSMRKIHSKACDLIAGFEVEGTVFFEITMQTLLNYFENDLISSIYISEGILDQIYIKGKNGIEVRFTIDKRLNFIETNFNQHLESLAYFIEGKKQFLKDEDYFRLIKEIELLKRSYYESINITLFGVDKAR